MAEPRPEPDYRFTLANERTFLAYIRTALGLDAAGLAAGQLLKPSDTGLHLAIAVVLILLGGVVSALGYRRWAAVERAMREGAPLPPVRVPLVLGLGLLVVSVAAVALVLVGR